MDMRTSQDRSGPVDSALQALVLVAQFYQLPVDGEQLSHQFSVPGKPFTDNEVLRAAKSLGLRAKVSVTPLGKISSATLPSVLKTNDGRYLVLAKIAEEGSSDEGKALVLDPSDTKAKPYLLSDLEALYTGEIILFTKRESLLEKAKEFDIRWFIPALKKHRKLFGEVILISFFL